MSWYKQKKNLRLRTCHIQISPTCQKIFKTKAKRAGKRTTCYECRKYLHVLGINVERYLDMDEPKEKLEWMDSDNIKVLIEKQIEIKNENQQVVGIKQEIYNQQSTYKELKEGIENLKEIINNDKQQLNILKKQFESLGKIPAKTSEVIRLEKNLHALAVTAKAEELRRKIDPLEEKINTNENILSKRKDFLNGRP